MDKLCHNDNCKKIFNNGFQLTIINKFNTKLTKHYCCKNCLDSQVDYYKRELSDLEIKYEIQQLS